MNAFLKLLVLGGWAWQGERGLIHSPDCILNLNRLGESGALLQTQVIQRQSPHHQHEQVQHALRYSAAKGTETKIFVKRDRHAFQWLTKVPRGGAH